MVTKTNVRKTLIEFWEAKTDKKTAQRAAKSLQRQAEIDVAKAQEDYETAKDAFDKAKMDAKDNTKEGFQKIVKTHRAMVVEKKDFDNAIEIYEALFEEKPRLLE
jgi:tetratricopeptide (TPR) repeat protein